MVQLQLRLYDLVNRWLILHHFTLILKLFEHIFRILIYNINILVDAYFTFDLELLLLFVSFYVYCGNRLSSLKNRLLKWRQPVRTRVSWMHLRTLIGFHWCRFISGHVRVVLSIQFKLLLFVF